MHSSNSEHSIDLSTHPNRINIAFQIKSILHSKSNQKMHSKSKSKNAFQIKSIHAFQIKSMHAFQIKSINALQINTCIPNQINICIPNRFLNIQTSNFSNLAFLRYNSAFHDVVCELCVSLLSTSGACLINNCK